MFNRLVGRKVALVYDTPGSHVTRDYKEQEASLLDLRFNLIDTSGLEPSMSCETIQGRATAITHRVCSVLCTACVQPKKRLAYVM
jgi:predicted GTPase